MSEAADDSPRMFRLIYNSHSQIRPEDRTSQLGDIFTTARRNNRGLGVSGALVITDDAFAQALEGEESVVRDLYESIGQDPRHNQVTLLEAQDVDARVFGRWAMAKVSADGARTSACSATLREDRSCSPEPTGA